MSVFHHPGLADCTPKKWNKMLLCQAEAGMGESAFRVDNEMGHGGSSLSLVS